LIIEGNLKIEHKDKYTKDLNKFDTDYFQGDWETKVFGKVRDFNLMTTGSVIGSLNGMRLKKTESFMIEITGQNKIRGVYCFKGKLEINTENQIFNLFEGDFALIEYDEVTSLIETTAVLFSEIVVVEIQFQPYLL
jgi:environmental stress-induced protein Ves